MNKELRRAECLRRAHELAATGRYADYLGIEAALIGQYPEARTWLDNASLREDLRLACTRARSAPEK